MPPRIGNKNIDDPLSGACYQEQIDRLGRGKPTLPNRTPIVGLAIMLATTVRDRLIVRVPRWRATGDEGRDRGRSPMNTEPASDGGQAMAIMTCPVCGKRVAAGAFCARCGAGLSSQNGDSPEWLRIRAYAAARGEHVLRLSVVSSLLPRLPHRWVTGFRVGLTALLLALVVFAVLRLQPPLIAISTFGLPLVFLTYLRLSDVYHDLPIPTLVVTALLAVGLGVGWALLTAPVIAHSYDVTLLSGMTGGRALWQRLAIPLGGAVLMLVPVVLARMSRRAIRESLDGFVIGSLGAISFTATATLTRLAPQLATGVVAHDRPVGSLLIEAGIQGLAVPLTAAAVGGMVGAALWFKRRADAPQQHRWQRLLRFCPNPQWY